jgi:LysM repeat protein
MNFAFEGEGESPDCFLTVEPGDSLAGISLKSGVPINLLKKYNHLFGKNDLYPGQVEYLAPVLQLSI